MDCAGPVPQIYHRGNRGFHALGIASKVPVAIAKVAAKIAIGYTLDEIKNSVTGTTYAAFEPAMDYVAVKFPKWPFDKFVYAKRQLGTQMKATGEVMSIGDSFEHAIMKAVRGAEIGLETLTLPKMEKLSIGELEKAMTDATDERLFALYEALKRGMTVEYINSITKVDKWFLHGLLNIARHEERLRRQPEPGGLYNSQETGIYG